MGGQDRVFPQAVRSVMDSIFFRRPYRAPIRICCLAGPPWCPEKIHGRDSRRSIHPACICQTNTSCRSTSILPVPRPRASLPSHAQSHSAGLTVRLLCGHHPACVILHGLLFSLPSCLLRLPRRPNRCVNSEIAVSSPRHGPMATAFWFAFRMAGSEPCACMALTASNGM